MSKIILITDLREVRARKEGELKFYNEQLKELLFKMSIINQEINLTTKIIDMIEHEAIVPVGTKRGKNENS